MLGDRIARHQSRVWLVNTGWSGGAYGTGSRMKIAFTRAMISAALEGALDGTPYERDPAFGLEIPTTCPGVPSEVLNPRRAWTNPSDYDAQARKLAAMFVENFKKFSGDVAGDVSAAGPRAAGA